MLVFRNMFVTWKTTSIVFLVILNSVFGIPKADPRIDPLVETKLGLIRGLRSDNGLFSSFLGIPYAVVDEENPFEQSVPHPGFEDAFNAYDSSIFCPQVNMGGDVIGEIQCLVLNIFVPNTANSQNRLPVMVYIHGGAFVSGSNSYIMGTPNALVEKDVIVVSINYRLGIYGFMCTDSPKAPGNIGLRDQLLALRWINEHIASFGGDSSRITAFGESAGSMSVHLHLLSHHEKLFDRAILQSGPATSPWSFRDLDNSVPLQISAKLGLVTEDVDEAIDFLSSTDFHLVIAAGARLNSSSQYTNEPLTKACIEKEFEGIEIFVSVNPNLAKPEKAKTIPIIIGFSEQEMIFQHGGQNAEFYDNYSFKDLLRFGFDVNNFDDMIDLIKHFYIGDEATNESLRNEITSFASDFIFNHPVERAVDLLIQSDAQVYHYIFSYIGGRFLAISSNSSMIAATHADEILYLFNTPYASTTTLEDLVIIDRLTTLWTNFAKYGDPLPETSDLFPVKWEPVSQEFTPYLNINRDLTLQSRPFHDRMAFWDLFYRLNDEKTKWNSAA